MPKNDYQAYLYGDTEYNEEQVKKAAQRTSTIDKFSTDYSIPGKKKTASDES